MPRERACLRCPVRAWRGLELARGGMIAMALALVLGVPAVAAAQGLTLAQVGTEAQRVHPQIRGAGFRWGSAEHQIIQNYTPADPQFSFSNIDSWRGINDAGEQSMLLT